MPGKTETQYLDALIHALAKEGFSVQRDVAVGSSSSDAFVSSTDGPNAVVEFKMWEPSPVNLKRARVFAAHLKDLSGADQAFILLPGLARNQPSSGVFSSDDPVAFVQYFASLAPAAGRRARPKVRRAPRKSVFVAMPFKPQYDDTYLVAIQPASLAAGAASARIDHAQFTGDIVREIESRIARCRAVVADLSESRPNVLYEVGVAHALGRPVIQICSTPLKDLPFDVRNNKTISYSVGQTSSLKTKLVRALKQAVK